MTKDEYLQTARDIIERMTKARPTCEKCERIAYTDVCSIARIFTVTPGEVIARALKHDGWDTEPNRAGLVKRCNACASALYFPWASQLREGAVAAFLELDARCRGSFPLSILVETLRDDIPMVAKVKHNFVFPVTCALEHGQSQTIGSVLREYGPPSPCFTIAKELYDHARQCGYSHELAVQLHYSPVEEHRTLTITGFCKLDHEHGKGDCKYEPPAAGGDDRLKPSGGFEFL